MKRISNQVEYLCTHRAIRQSNMSSETYLKYVKQYKAACLVMHLSARLVSGHALVSVTADSQFAGQHSRRKVRLRGLLFNSSPLTST